MSPTARSLKWLKDRGWRARVVEKWIPFKKIRQDCFGGDILAIHVAQKATMLIQATSASNHTSRVKKSLANPEVADWIAAGNEFQVWSWKKGVRKPRREVIELSDLQKRRKGRK